MVYQTSYNQREFEKSLIGIRRRSLEEKRNNKKKKNFAIPILQPIRLGLKSISTKKIQYLQKARNGFDPFFVFFIIS